MMLHYLVTVEDMNLVGVRNKISGQLKALNEIGIPARLHIFKSSNERLLATNLPADSEVIEFDGPTSDSLLTKMWLEANRYRSIRKTITSFSADEVVYLRYINLDHIPRKKRCRVIVEHQTMESIQFRLGKSPRNRLSCAIEMVRGKHYRRKADGRVGVTKEILNYEMERAKDQAPSLVIPNGIDIKDIETRAFLANDDGAFRIVGLANIAPWHGYDRVLEGISRYRGPRRIEFMIVGNPNSDFSLLDACKRLKVQDNVVFLGELSRAEFSRLISKSHVAVGTLAAHRKGLSETSSLKHREYCAMGIPFLYSGSDPDFPLDFPYAIRLDPFSPLDMEEIIARIDRILSDGEHPIKMHRYAEEHLDWKVKMRKLADWLYSF